MPRYFAPISEKDLIDKILNAWVKHEDYNIFDKDDFGKLSYRTPFNELTPTITKDIKVSFGTDNVNFEDRLDSPYESVKDDFLGVKTLDNGMTYFGIQSASDEEIFLYFIIYWDGKKLRGYVPKDGNTWNTKTNQAYGSDDDDIKNIIERCPDLWNALPKEEQDGFLNYGDIDDLDIKADKEKIRKDIKERILPKTSDVSDPDIETTDEDVKQKEKDYRDRLIMLGSDKHVDNSLTQQEIQDIEEFMRDKDYSYIDNSIIRRLLSVVKKKKENV